MHFESCSEANKLRNPTPVMKYIIITKAFSFPTVMLSVLQIFLAPLGFFVPLLQHNGQNDIAVIVKYLLSLASQQWLLIFICT